MNMERLLRTLGSERACCREWATDWPGVWAGMDEHRKQGMRACFPKAISLRSLKGGSAGPPLMAGLNHTFRHRCMFILKASGCSDCGVRIRDRIFTGFSFAFRIAAWGWLLTRTIPGVAPSIGHQGFPILQ